MTRTGREYVPVRELVPALHPGSARRRWLVVMRLYVDTSGKDNDLVRVAAGYLASAAQWEKFEAEWARALRSAKVNAFHATDFFSFKGEFNGWDANIEKHIRFAKLFTAIAAEQTQIGVGRGIESEPFHRIIGPEMRGLRHAPHRRFTSLMVCALGLLDDIARLWGERTEPIAVLFEAEPGIGEVIEYFHSAKARGVPFTKAYASIGQAAKSFLPLQAADLLAHECWRELKEHIRPSGRPRPRKSMQRLARGESIQLAMVTEKDMHRILPDVRLFMSENSAD
jgi:hypothetical protein